MMSRWDRLKVVLPTLDVMQAMPSFVYPVPVVMLAVVGRVPNLLGGDFTRSAGDPLHRAFAWSTKTCWKPLTPLVLPPGAHEQVHCLWHHHHGRCEQTIMLSLAMVVIASMIGVQGLGQPVLKRFPTSASPWAYSVKRWPLSASSSSDRVCRAYGKRLQEHWRSSMSIDSQT
jgi:glycine betaine/proline transport system permease protein